MKLILGITGASGVIYGIRMLEVLSSMKDVETHLVISKAGELTIRYETPYSIEDVRALADVSYDISDIAAPVSSGSFGHNGMIVAPCTAKTLSAIANSYNDNLLVRAADVTLKERRKLVLLLRETPLHAGHIRSMQQVTEMGAIVMPPVPAFYHKPQSIQGLIDHIAGKTLDLFDIPHNLFKRWSGIREEE